MMTIRPTSRQFSLRPESELLVWCARTAVTDALKERIRQRVQEPLDWAGVLDMAEVRWQAIFSLKPSGKPICVFLQRTGVGMLVTRYGPHCLQRLCRGNRKYSTTDSRAYVGLDVMSKAAPGTPGLSDRVFYGFGNGECWNSH